MWTVGLRQWSRGSSIIPKLCCACVCVCVCVCMGGGVCMCMWGMRACTVCVRACACITKWILTSKVITEKEIIKLWSKQNRWSHKSSIHMLDWCLCRRTMNHCLSMLESKHKGRYEYRKLSLLLLHTDTYCNARTSSFISRKSTFVNDL